MKSVPPGSWRRWGIARIIPAITGRPGILIRVRPDSDVAITTPLWPAYAILPPGQEKNLKGRSTQERVLAIVTIAHLSFRDSLKGAVNSNCS